MADLNCKVLVIGAGPGGYVCAIRAGQLGLDTIIVEEAGLGGTCLNVGCIPSKAIIHAADEFHKLTQYASGDHPLGISASAPGLDLRRTIEWKDGIVKRLNTGVAGLLKRAGVRTVEGTARFLDGKTVAVTSGNAQQKSIRAEHIVIATGSAPIELPDLPFGGDIISSTDALALAELPDRLAVVGGGYIGLEIGTAFAKLGSAVTIIEAEDHILPQYDTELTRPVSRRLKALGITVMTAARARSLEGGKLTVETGSGVETLATGKVLVTVGRRPRTRGSELEELSLTFDGPFIEIDDRCQTSMRSVYAIGDVTGEPMLAHRAMAQGEMVAELLAGRDRSWDRVCIPAVCFTDPEIVTAGLSPDEAAASGRDIQTASFPFQANGRAMTTERDDGFVRVVTRKDNGLLLGIQAVGAGVSELSATFALALEMGATLDDIAATVHAHPTLSEGFHEACLRTLGHAIHI